MGYLMSVITALERLKRSDAAFDLNPFSGHKVDHCGRKPKAFATVFWRGGGWR